MEKPRMKLKTKPGVCVLCGVPIQVYGGKKYCSKCRKIKDDEFRDRWNAKVKAKNAKK